MRVTGGVGVSDVCRWCSARVLPNEAMSVEGCESPRLFRLLIGVEVAIPLVLVIQITCCWIIKPCLVPDVVKAACQ